MFDRFTERARKEVVMLTLEESGPLRTGKRRGVLCIPTFLLPFAGLEKPRNPLGTFARNYGLKTEWSLSTEEGGNVL